MAIIDEYTVNILINGQPCKEYDGWPEKGRGPKKVARYIEAISDAPYKIYLEMLRSVEITTEAVAYHISIDGDLVSKILPVRSNQRRFREIISRIPVGGVDHSFSFTDIKRTKREHLLDPYISDDKLKRIGAILVEVYRYDVPEQTPKRVQEQSSHLKVLQAQRKIPKEKINELDLTSLTHSTRLVELNSSDRGYYVDGSQLDPFPLVAFEFRCCSSKILRTQLSIPMALPIRQRARMEEPFNVTNIQQPKNQLAFRPLKNLLQKPIMEEPLNATRIQEPNIQKNQDILIKEGRNNTIINRRKREHRDEGESEEHIEKSRKLSSQLTLLERMTWEAERNLRGIHTLRIPAPIPIVRLVDRIKEEEISKSRKVNK